MRHAWMFGLLLLPACATVRGGEVEGRDRNTGDALRCAMGEAGRLGYRLTDPPATQGVQDGAFRAERWLSPRETGARSLGVLSVYVREHGAGGTRLRVDADRFEEEWRGGSSGPGITGTGRALPPGPGVGGRPGPSSVDSIFRGRSARREGMKRVSSGPVGRDADEVRRQCSASGDD